jgi:CelD/BcsL family acetyltransferase involved in cellulose biosynthesis
VVRDYDSLRQLAPDWAALSSRSSCENVFLTIEWMEEWWLRFGAGQSLFVIALHDSTGRLIGVAPFCVGPPLGQTWGFRSLKFLGSKWVSSDHLELLVESGFERTAAREVTRIIVDHRKSWDYIEFADYDEASLTMAELRKALREFGLKAHVMQRGVCPYIPLPGSFETYLAGLNSNWRRNFRHALRALQHSTTIQFSVLKDIPAIRQHFSEAMALHRRRLEALHEASTFLDEAQQAFHSAVLSRMVPRGWARLYLLEADGIPVAAYYGFSVQSRFFAMQSGLDPVWARHSVGLVMVGLAIEESIRSGHQEFDFLRGNERYKLHWGAHVRESTTSRFFTTSMTGSLLLAASCIVTTLASVRSELRQRIEARPSLNCLLRRIYGARSSNRPQGRDRAGRTNSNEYEER